MWPSILRVLYFRFPEGKEHAHSKFTQKRTTENGAPAESSDCVSWEVKCDAGTHQGYVASSGIMKQTTKEGKCKKITPTHPLGWKRLGSHSPTTRLGRSCRDS